MNHVFRTLVIGLIFFGHSFVLRAQLIVNEVSQGPSGNKEYVELLVQGTPGCTDYFVNLSQWILDDNCGFFGQGSGTGIAPGHLRFRNVAPWTQIRYGSLILIYNSADPNGLIPPHDYFDANGDCVYVLPDTCYLFERGNLPLSSTGISSYAGSTYISSSSWASTLLANGGDAIATIAPGNLSAPYHAVAWGNSSLGQSIYFANSAAGRSYRMMNIQSDNPFQAVNWEALDVSFLGSETPGLPNGMANDIWIQKLKSGCANYVQVFQNVSRQLCFGDSLFIAGQWRYSSGLYTDTLPAQIGCDTIETIQLTVLSVVNTPLQVSVCTGESYIFNGIAISTSGIYTDTLIASSGCDSILTLNVTVWPLYADTQSVGICAGTGYFFGGQSYSQQGVYIDTLLSQQGCDSFSVLQLSILPVYRDTMITGICPGGSYSFGGMMLSQSGVYVDTMISSVGCDSVVVLQLEVSNAFTTVQQIQVCAEEEYFFNGQWLSQSGVYYDTLPAALGCDSIIELQFIRLPVPISSFNLQLCIGDSFQVGGVFYDQSGIFRDTIISSLGCDSVREWNVQFLPVSSVVIDAFICPGDEYVFQGQPVTQAGYYTDTLTGVNGCDSIIQVHLQYYPVYTDTAFLQSCTGSVLVWRGLTIVQSGIYTDTLVSVTGCDSILLAIADFNAVYADSQVYVICYGDTFQGKVWVTDSVQLYSYLSEVGCDSVFKEVFDVVEPLHVSLGADQWVEPGTAVVLTADFPSAQWSNGVNGQSVVLYPEDTTLYWVIQEDMNGCESTDSVTIYTYPSEISLWSAPTAFSPNGDGKNDVFRLLLQPGVRLLELMVFNRWGERVFLSDAFNQGWDGTYLGEEQEIGVYVFTGLIIGPDGSSERVRGQFSLLR